MKQTIDLIDSPIIEYLHELGIKKGRCKLHRPFFMELNPVEMIIYHS